MFSQLIKLIEKATLVIKMPVLPVEKKEPS